MSAIEADGERAACSKVNGFVKTGCSNTTCCSAFVNSNSPGSDSTINCSIGYCLCCLTFWGTVWFLVTARLEGYSAVEHRGERSKKIPFDVGLRLLLFSLSSPCVVKSFGLSS